MKYDFLEKEKFIEEPIGELAKRYMMIFGTNINLARISANLIDGLKPVQRRALYIMYLKDGGKKFRKLVSISGDVVGKAHPHGETACQSAIVLMTQPWRNSIPLIEGYGNHGSASGAEAGAARYIQERLSEYSQVCFFEDFKDSVVDMELSFDDETMLPVYLPARYPNIFLNGTLGIGIGQAVNIPSFNFREVVEACIALMRNENAKIVLIPDSTTGADIVEADFAGMCERGLGSYTQRCRYEIDPENNIITITALPELVTAIDIREKIATLKEQGDLHALMNMEDLSGAGIELRLTLRDDANPYKFMKKLIQKISGLERSYPINITITYDLQTYDWSISRTLLEWVKWRRGQKRMQLMNKRSTLMGEQRILEIKLFIMNEKNCNETVRIFREGNNREEIENELMKRYHDSVIHMDSLQARTLSNMRMVDLSKDAYKAYQSRLEEVNTELGELNGILDDENGIDKVIIGELRDGIKRFGTPRRSNVVPKEISIGHEVEGLCILQLSSDGILLRRQGTNAEEEPIPTDSNGFACLVDNDSSFVIVDSSGMYSIIKAKELPVDTEVPVARYSKKEINGNIVAMLPVDLDNDKCCILISKKGVVKRVLINDLKPSKRPCISLEEGDKLVRGGIMDKHTNRDLLIYTKSGFGQRLDPKSIRITSPLAKGGSGFKLDNEDEIIGCYAIDPQHNEYLLYVTKNGKVRLNNIQYLPVRNSKHDSMVKLIQLSERDKLVAVVGCNKLDKVQVFFDDNDSEEIDVSKLQESTMAAEPKKVTKKNAVTSNITKVKIL